MNFEELAKNLKKQIVVQLNLNEVNPEDINTDEPLFGKGLGLDSIDALELIILLEEKYGIKFGTSEDGPKTFYSVRTIAEYIIEHKPN
ncbi:MAG: acyl carrier protein [Bacteroidetes bacterium]|nr:acyl carrier protein [Bacteroidota bacterium]MBK8674002.1 acyl carrier protein [Bacteroidota bacterium]